MHSSGFDNARIQPAVGVSLHNQQSIVRRVLASDKPWLAVSTLRSADAETLPLAERVVCEALVPADDDTFRRLHRPGFLGQVAGEKLAERPLADEADAGRIFLGVGRNALFARQRAYLALGHVAKRKKRAAELVLRKLMQEIGLILGRVGRLQQFDATARETQPRVMAGGNALRTQRSRVVQKRSELDLAVAQHIGVRRAAGSIFAQEGSEDAIAILGREIHRLQLDPHDVRDRCRVDQILSRRAEFVSIVIFPVFHEDADDLVARLLEQPRGDR